MTNEQLKSKVEELEKELAKFKKELDEKDKSPYGERSVGNEYYAINARGEIITCIDRSCNWDKMRYDFGNYFSDKSFAEKVLAEQTLTNLLRRYTYEHGWSDDLWDDSSKVKYCIAYEHDCKEFTVSNWYDYHFLNTVYFNSFGTAHNAIQEVVIPFVKEHPELGYELKD